MTSVATNGEARKRKRESKAFLGREIFTAGQVGEIVGVAPRTVAKWLEAGVLRGYRLPTGSRDRRFRREDVLAFLEKQKMPVPSCLVDAPAVLLVGLDRDLLARLGLPGERLECATLFQAGLLYEQHRPAAVVIDVSAVGVAWAGGAARALAQQSPRPRLIALLPEDQPLRLAEGFDAALSSPVDPARLAEALAEGVAP